MIIGILEAISCKTRGTGRQLWAFIYRDVQTEKTVGAQVCGDYSNITAAMQALVGRDNVKHIHTVLHTMTYSAFVQQWFIGRYAGSHPDEIAKWIREALQAPTTPEGGQ